MERYEVRLVAKDFLPRPGVDFTDIFALVANYSTNRLSIELLVHFASHRFQFYVKNTFLNAPFKGEIYIKEPPGFVAKGSDGRAYQPKNALYRLR